MGKTFIILFLTASCGNNSDCRIFNYASQFNYKTNFNQTTPLGIQIDTSNQQIDLNLIDALTAEVEQCLTKNFPNHTLPANVMISGQCAVKLFDCPFNRSCFKIKIPNDWVWSCDKTQQLLPYNTPQAGCIAKGLMPNAECPCRWRGGLQGNIIVTTPSLIIYKDPLIRLLTGCNNPWSDPILAECASNINE